jgi:hypothetical protein
MCVALVGRRAVRDYTLSQDDRHAIEWFGTSSPFNINAELTTLELFTAAEVESLLLQHTTATGQRFDPDAIARVHELGATLAVHLAAEGFTYKESGPHLMMMAFLQRIVNGGGTIDREYALGKGALDLLVTWKTQRLAIELKIRRDTDTEDEALEQVFEYLDVLDAPEGWIVLFDLRSTKPWSERNFLRDVTLNGRTVHVVGC